MAYFWVSVTSGFGYEVVASSVKGAVGKVLMIQKKKYGEKMPRTIRSVSSGGHYWVNDKEGSGLELRKIK